MSGTTAAASCMERIAWVCLAILAAASAALFLSAAVIGLAVWRWGPIGLVALPAAAVFWYGVYLAVPFLW